MSHQASNREARLDSFGFGLERAGIAQLTPILAQRYL
jgi:hypothetical protein